MRHPITLGTAGASSRNPPDHCYLTTICECITGAIKANFPARVAFRVTSRIDSRTILDSGGAEQLIGRGDMLYIQGNELIRLQCAFVDTPEVEKLTDFMVRKGLIPMRINCQNTKGRT